MSVKRVVLSSVEVPYSLDEYERLQFIEYSWKNFFGLVLEVGSRHPGPILLTNGSGGLSFFSSSPRIPDIFYYHILLS